MCKQFGSTKKSCNGIFTQSQLYAAGKPIHRASHSGIVEKTVVHVKSEVRKSVMNKIMERLSVGK